MPDRITAPRELLAARLREMLWIELALANEVLPGMIDAANAPALRAAFERDLLETRQHVETLRDVLGDLRVSAEPEQSAAFTGLVAEHEQLVRRCPDDAHLMTDLAHSVAALATEHLELATYEALVSVADALGEEEAAIRLREVLEQEQFALEQVEAALARLLAEKVESDRF
jgi:ferritin-like metal-binding protein YciE